MFVRTALLFSLTVPASAQAFVWIGNPKLHIRVDRPAEDIASAVAEVGALRVHKCGGGFDTYAIGETVDLSSTLEQTIAGADICGVSVVWDGALAIEGDGWEVEYDESWTPVSLSGPDPESVALTPFEVVSGSFSGGPPRLYAWID